MHWVLPCDGWLAICVTKHWTLLPNKVAGDGVNTVCNRYIEIITEFQTSSGGACSFNSANHATKIYTHCLPHSFDCSPGIPPPPWLHLNFYINTSGRWGLAQDPSLWTVNQISLHSSHSSIKWKELMKLMFTTTWARIHENLSKSCS